MSASIPLFFFFFNDTATTEIYTLSLHDALPIYPLLIAIGLPTVVLLFAGNFTSLAGLYAIGVVRSEEHTSELQSRRDLVCRLLLEKKKKKKKPTYKTYILIATNILIYIYVVFSY